MDTAPAGDIPAGEGTAPPAVDIGLVDIVPAVVDTVLPEAGTVRLAVDTAPLEDIAPLADIAAAAIADPARADKVADIVVGPARKQEQPDTN